MILSFRTKGSARPEGGREAPALARQALVFFIRAVKSSETKRNQGMRSPGWARMRPPWGGRAHAVPQGGPAGKRIKPPATNLPVRMVGPNAASAHFNRK